MKRIFGLHVIAALLVYNNNRVVTGNLFCKWAHYPLSFDLRWIECKPIVDFRMIKLVCVTLYYVQ